MTSTSTAPLSTRTKRRGAPTGAGKAGEQRAEEEGAQLGWPAAPRGIARCGEEEKNTVAFSSLEHDAKDIDWVRCDPIRGRKRD